MRVLCLYSAVLFVVQCQSNRSPPSSDIPSPIKIDDPPIPVPPPPVPVSPPAPVSPPVPVPPPPVPPVPVPVPPSNPPSRSVVIPSPPSSVPVKSASKTDTSSFTKFAAPSHTVIIENTTSNSNTGVAALIASGSFPFNSTGYGILGAVVAIVIIVVLFLVFLRRRSRKSELSDRRYDDLSKLRNQARKPSNGSGHNFNPETIPGRTAGMVLYDESLKNQITPPPPAELHQISATKYQNKWQDKDDGWNSTIKGSSIGEYNTGTLNSSRYSDLFDDQDYLPDVNTPYRDYGNFH